MPATNPQQIEPMEFEHRFSCFDIVHKCDERTDGQAVSTRVPRDA